MRSGRAKWIRASSVLMGGGCGGCTVALSVHTGNLRLKKSFVKRITCCEGQLAFFKTVKQINLKYHLRIVFILGLYICSKYLIQKPKSLTEPKHLYALLLHFHSQKTPTAPQFSSWGFKWANSGVRFLSSRVSPGHLRVDNRARESLASASTSNCVCCHCNYEQPFRVNPLFFPSQMIYIISHLLSKQPSPGLISEAFVKWSQQNWHGWMVRSTCKHCRDLWLFCVAACRRPELSL